MATLDRVWIAYLLAALAVGVLADGGGDPAHRQVAFLALHGGLLAVQLWLRAFADRLPGALPVVLRVLAAIASAPLTFSAMGWLLPAVHPEPWEWRWHAFDRAVFGADPTVVLQGTLTPWSTEVLQWCYAAFYLLPIGACLCVLRCAGRAAFDRSVVIVVFGFLVSYLGYLLFPTLPPYRFLDHGAPLQGIWLAEELNALLYAAEANRWDCFPSGHTMLSLVSVALVWRHARRWLWLFLPVATLLVFSTMALRYPGVIVVRAGAVGVGPRGGGGGRRRRRAGAAPPAGAPG